MTKALAPRRAIARPDDPYAVLLERFFSRISADTLRQYKAAVRHFARWMGEPGLNKFLAMPGPEAHLLAQEWVDAMVASGFAPSTISQRLSILRQFVDMANGLGQCPWILNKRLVKGPKVRNASGVPRLGSFEKALAQWAALRKHLERSIPEATLGLRDGTIGRTTAVLLLRDLTMLRIMYGCAMRRIDIVRIDAANVELSEMRIGTMPKGHVQITWRALSTGVAEILKHWMTMRAAWLRERGRVSPALFPSEKSDRMSVRAVSHMIERRAKEAGVALKPHDFRRLSITNALDKADGNYREAMDISGHAKPDTLINYDIRRGEAAHRLAELIDSDND